MVAELPLIPGADVALASVRRGNFSGLSVEFDAIKEHDDHGVRVIEKATLRGNRTCAAASVPVKRSRGARA